MEILKNYADYINLEYNIFENPIEAIKWAGFSIKEIVKLKYDFYYILLDYEKNRKKVLKKEVEREIFDYMVTKKRIPKGKRNLDYDEKSLKSFNPLKYENLFDFLIEKSIDYNKSIKDYVVEKIASKYSNEDLKDYISNITLEISNNFVYQVEVDIEEIVNIKDELFKYINSNFDIYAIVYDIIFDMNMNTQEIYDNYVKICNELNVNVKYKISYIKIGKDERESILLDKLLKFDLMDIVKKDIKIIPKKFNKKYNKIKNAIYKLSETKVIYSKTQLEKFSEMARNELKNYFKCKYSTINDLGRQDFEIDIMPLLKKYIASELAYYDLCKSDVSLENLYRYDECIKHIFLNGIIWTTQYTYLAEETKNKIINMMPTHPKNEYFEARRIKRKFIVHVGSTNTGKTYQSLQRLKESKTGVYLAPLRLLALEVQNALREQNVKCSLTTGEEEDIIEDATHISCTIEKADIKNHYEVCVIDEAQMLADNQRGFAWTRAILGMKANEIHICVAPEGLDIVEKLIIACNDSYEIVEHKRDTELVLEKNDFQFPKNVKKGDALIVFSKKKVLQIASVLDKNNIKASIIYGALPYFVRKKQLEKFLSGETDVVVSTDAIGMGLNLPINRIVFLETTKFDGISDRNLKIGEIKQIAGRAGRKGIFDIGYVNTLENKDLIKMALEEKTPVIKKAYLGFSEELLSIDAELKDILNVWKNISNNDIFNKTDINRYLELISRLDFKAPKDITLKMVTLPFDENNKCILGLWQKYCRDYIYNKPIKKPSLNDMRFKNTDKLRALENYYKCLDLYYSFSKNFDYDIDFEWLNVEKQKTSENINQLLISDIGKHQRKCKVCGKELDWNYPYAMCNRCYREKDFYWYDDLEL